MPPKYSPTLRNLEFWSKKEVYVLREATITYIANFLTNASDLKDLRDTFLQLDKDGNGELSKKEVAEGYVKVFGERTAGAKLNEIFKRVDKDASGTVSYDG